MRALAIVSILGLFVSATPQTVEPRTRRASSATGWCSRRSPSTGSPARPRSTRISSRARPTIKPKAGDKVTVGGKQLTWTAHQTSDYFIDFLQSFGKERGEYVAGYAVAYVIADEDMKVTLALSTNDQGKAWLNGKPVFKFAETRTLEKDTDKSRSDARRRARTCWCSRSSTR